MNRTPKRLFSVSCNIWLILIFLSFPCLISAKENKPALPTAARVVLAQAGKMVTNNNYDQAIDLLTTFREKAPANGQVSNDNSQDIKGYHHPQIYNFLGFCYLMKNQYKEAREAFEYTVKQDDQHLSGWLNLAKACYELHDYPRAAECFTRAYSLSPDKNVELLYYGAVAYLLAEQYKPSIAIFDRILADHSDKIQPAWRENLVHALLGSDQARLALPHIKLLAAEYDGKKKVRWQEILLHQYMQLEMVAQALTYANKLAEQAPTQRKWWKALASIYLQKGNYTKALTALVIDSYLEPLSEQESKLVADLYLQLGIPSMATSRYQDILKKKANPQLVERLVLALRQLGQEEQALVVLDKFAPNNMNPALLMQKADLLYVLGRYLKAAELYAQTAKKESRQKDRALQMARYAMLQASYMDDSQHKEKQERAF